MKKITIVILLTAALAGAFCLLSHSQQRDKCPSVVTVLNEPGDTILLGDETTLNYGKTEAVIQSNNESVFTAIFKTHGTLFTRFTCKWQKDGNKRYKRYTAYLSNGDAKIIQSWAKTNL